MNIGTQSSATGEDPSVEDDYKGGKDDPGSTHPARTDNDSLAELKTTTDALSNGILADMINGQTLQKTAEEDGVCDTGAATLNPAAAGDKPPKQPKQQVAGEGLEEKVAEADPTDGGLNDKIDQATAAVQAEKLAHSKEAANPTEQAYLAGYELAAGLGLEKTAAEQLVADGVESVISDAQMDAELFASYFSTHVKQAMEMDASDEGEDHSQEGDDTSGAGDAEGAGGETDGGPAASEPTDAGPVDGPGGMAAEGGGGGLGDPGGLAAPPMGGDPMAGGGDPMAGGEMGQPSEEEALMQLVAALEELSVPTCDRLSGAPPACGRERVCVCDDERG